MLDKLKEIAKSKGLTPQLGVADRDNFYWSREWFHKREEVKARDNYECQVCKSQGRVTLNNLIVHHVKPLEFYPKLKLDDDNLITVCKSCHNRIHFEIEDDWHVEWW